MRKRIALFLAVMMMAMMALSAAALADTTLGQALYAAHGTRAFCVATVAMDGDTIVTALIDEFQFLSPDGFEPVPNPESFTNADGNVLAPKRANDEAYSTAMSGAGATQSLVTSYKAIEAFVAGKTVEELEAFIDGKTAEDLVDAVASCTLTDTLGYLEAIILAAKNAG